MNKKICKMIIENRKRVVPHLFTARQLNIMNKYINGTEMTPTEKTYLYSSIKKKIKAIDLFHTEYYVTGRHMISERVANAKEILEELNKDRAFISGSFLFSEKYNDIDIFIISRKRTQYRKGKRHFIFITESDLKKPIFASPALYSVSNFLIPDFKTDKKRRSQFDENVLAYELSIGEVLDNEESDYIRYLVIEYYLQVKNRLLNAYELQYEVNMIRNNSKNIEIINMMIEKIIKNSYSSRYIYDILARFTKRLAEDIKSYKANENLIIYKEVFDKIKNDCRPVKT